MSAQKSILITGCSSGIGYYCALQLSQQGYQVIASVRNPEHLNKFAGTKVQCIWI